jgi:GAF domain-containing protein
MFFTFTLLWLRGLHVMVAAVGATVVGMAANALVNHASVRTAPAVWARIAMDHGVRASLERLAEQVGAHRAYLLPAERSGVEPAGVPAELLNRVVRGGRPAAWTEAPSHRPQRRTNIESTSLLLVPAVRDGKVFAVVVCERRAPRGFLPEALETATRAVDALAERLGTDTEVAVAAAVAPRAG